MTNKIDEYYRLLKKYEDEYGKNVIVLIQDGHYYEIYGDKYDEEQIKLCKDILGFKVIQKYDKLACTFRYNMYKYYEKTILTKGYTIVYVDQVPKFFPYKRFVWDVREIKESTDTYSNDSGCSILTCLYASCCPSLYVHNLRTYD